MKTNRIITILVLVCVALGASAKKKEPDYPRAEIKVAYNYHEKFMRGEDGVVERDVPMMLLANREGSKFYCPDTEYKDSLESTPSGRAKSKEILHAAIREYSSGKNIDAMDAISYKTFMYIFKDVAASAMTVYDKAGLTDYGCYTEPLNGLEWIIGDSIKEVLGYECQTAEADYHGRHWTVWFSSDIPLQDGPWKLSGLPGLILEASEPSGQHHFIATGIETTDMQIVPIYPTNDYERMSRQELLRGRRNSLENGMSIFRAQTGYDLGVSDAPVTEESRKYDFLETDYH